MEKTSLHDAVQRLMNKSNYSYVAAGDKLAEAKYDRHRHYASLIGSISGQHRYSQYNVSEALVRTVAGDVISVLVDKKYSDLEYRDAFNHIVVEHPVLRAMSTSNC
jgi:hypothetical protein